MSLFSLTNSLVFVSVTHLGEYRNGQHLWLSYGNYSGNRASENGCENDEYGDLNHLCLLEMEGQRKIEVPLPGNLMGMAISRAGNVPNIKVTLEPENMEGKGSHAFSRLFRSLWSEVVNMSQLCCNHPCQVHGRYYK